MVEYQRITLLKYKLFGRLATFGGRFTLFLSGIQHVQSLDADQKLEEYLLLDDLVGTTQLLPLIFVDQLKLNILTVG